MGCQNATVIENESARELLSPIDFGPYKSKNRVMYAAMTRCRADPKDGVPTDLIKQYYADRCADPGIMLSECCAVNSRGEGFPGACQVFSKDQIEGWKKVIDAVHKNKGKLFIQLYHCGRCTWADNINGEKPVSSSTKRNTHREGKFDEPEALDIEGIKKVVEDFKNAAKALKEIGADGVQLHCANGYLVDQFLRDGVNDRTDEYGGSIENRARFMFEVLDELIKVFGASRVGVKLSPCGRYNDMYDSDPQALLDYLLPELDKRRICFTEVMRPPDGTPTTSYDKTGEEQIPDLFKGMKAKLPNVILVGNSGISPEEASKLIKEKVVDMVSFGRSYISNPDLCERISHNWPISSDVDWATAFYGGEKGYNDYPKYERPQKEETPK